MDLDYVGGWRCELEFTQEWRARGVPKASLSARAVLEYRACVETFTFSHYEQGGDGSVHVSAELLMAGETVKPIEVPC